MKSRSQHVSEHRPAARDLGRPGRRYFSSLLGLLGLILVSASGTRASDVIELPPSTPFDSPFALQARALRGLRSAVVGEIFSGNEGGDLAFATLAMPVPGADDRARVALSIEIDGATFLKFNTRDLARFEIYVYALGANRQLVDYLAEVFAVDVAEQGERIWQSGFEYFGGLDLPAGDYELRVLVRHFQSGISGLAVVPLAVPDFAAGEPRALTPLIADPSSRDVWLPVRSWEARRDGGEKGYPMLVFGSGINPAVKPVLLAGKRSEVQVPLVGVESGDLDGALELVADNEAGTVVAEADVTVGGRKPTPAIDTELLTASFVSPAVPPGAYRARVKLRTASGAEVVTREIDVLVAGEGIRETDLLWSDMSWLVVAAKKKRSSPLPLEVARIRKPSAKEIRQAQEEIAATYRSLVGEVSGARSEEALAGLFEFEADALRRVGHEQLGAVHQAELLVAESLGDDDPEAILPLVLLHSEMYRRYRSRRMYSLLQHSRSLLEELADLYVELEGSPENGARILADLAGHLQAANLPGGSRRLFGRALEYDPASGAALLGLGASLEKNGEYTEAISYYEALVAAEPGFDEGVLRLAVNLERVGLGRRSLELLERLVERGGSSWVDSVAAQELARVYLRAEDLPRAADLLEQASERMPSRNGLRFLLAHVYDRLGETREALSRLMDIDPAARSRPSERLIYDRWPQALLERARADLVRVANQVHRSGPSVDSKESQEDVGR